MKVSELGLPEIAQQKLAQLAMSIEIHCRQRFSTCKTVVEIAAMLIVADTCGIELVRRRKQDFLGVLPPQVVPVLEAMTGHDDCIEILQGRGITYRGNGAVLVEKPVQLSDSQRSYRGSQQVADASGLVSAQRAVRMYRGCVIED